ncbi:MAG: hypothetical protein ACTHMS_04325 [Jatrophihabitans sp.]|uniref:hypothetical protein n=1 Tax=Jatrophihabitans sp. TaxID=1932789 RepID=UPI003F8048B1
MARSQTERLWLIGGTIVGVVMLLLGYLLFISPERDDTASVRDQVSSAQAANAQLQAKLAQLQQQDKQRAKYQAAAAAARQALPQTSDLSTFLRSLQNIGSATNSDVSSLTAGTPVDVTTVATTGTVATASRPTAAPTNVAAANASILNGSSNPAPAAAVATGPRVYALPINATVSGSVDALNAFLTQLQAVQPRAVLITSIMEGIPDKTTAKTAQVPQLVMTFSAFVAPATAAESSQLQAAAAGK